MAKLNFYYGAMNSGKSAALAQTRYNYLERGGEVIVTKPSIDTKGDTRIIARSGSIVDVDFLTTPTMNLRLQIEIIIKKRHLEATKKAHKLAILVDESQFLTEQQVDQLYEVTKDDNIPVVAYGLLTDFNRQLFPGSKRLVELAERQDRHLVTLCHCMTQAIFNARKINGQFVFGGEQVAIDGKDAVTYESLCGIHYLEELRKATI